VRLPFPPPAPGERRALCLHCLSARISEVDDAGRPAWRCTDCGTLSPRRLLFDPGVRSWVDSDGEYWHETAGVVVVDPQGDCLLFERRLFPYQVTIPAGHVDAGEDPADAAVREVAEEVGLDLPTLEHLEHLVDTDIRGDSCRRGSDAHRWHLYRVRLPARAPVRLGEEGLRAMWLCADEARGVDLTVPVRHFLARFGGWP
jgi:8-oxo-dGTP pyrophosphatase MutT (NUDIX family)